jgi:hypothetical protein
MRDETYLDPLGHNDYEIKTQGTGGPLYKVPQIQNILRETLAKIIESRIITH